ncbi:ATP-binding protein [Enterobacter hormaechei]|uniref:ATP-binding protein n=1 Tax=Enterobacter hormaechei TaxID=158836 RepID=UPI0023B86521|nr:ATP-binding protein [Enterobacter hormaechei]
MDGTQTQGTGLGLAIVRQIVDRMGGQIALAPGPGGIGMAVTVWLRRTSAPAAG